LFYKYKENKVKQKFLYSDIKIRNALRTNWLKKQNANLVNVSLGGLGDEDRLILQKVLRRLDIFDLGVLLIHCTVGNIIDCIDFSTYICEHDFKCCCLYHCLMAYEHKNKFKLTDMLSKRYSREFTAFLCHTTTYHYDKQISFKRLKNHDWMLSNPNDYVYLNLQELLTISRSFFTRSDYLKANKRLDYLAESITNILSCCDSYFQHYGIEDTHLMFNEANEKNIIELSNEMGVEKDILVARLKPLYDLIFK
jgi:hypothetical protein